ncbi:hypothetical protein ZIOFF_019486 [Zingiber officinale]|uniref:Uncharacterized protein n=1 Tax=Zingiber officinale TaxID=94328 RepID=A0A8J5HRT4_ZINOF|nr:hypothetical protein ZIOFF_019486 [Zingiber officinale]
MPTSAAIDGHYPPHLVQRGDASSEAAERRLQEAEKRLREAIEELQRHHNARRSDEGGCGGDMLPCCDHDDSCIAHAIGNLCQSFLLSYGVRVGIGILLRAFKLARRQSYSSIIDLKVSMLLLASFYAGNEISAEAISGFQPIEGQFILLISMFVIQQLVSEKDLIVREEACRIGLLFGGFTGSYHALRCFLRKFRRKETPINV